MKTNSQNAANVIDFAAAKVKAEKIQEARALKNYLKALTFSELIDETSYLIDDIKSVGSTSEVIFRSTSILKELSERLSKSQGLSQNLVKMYGDLEERLSHIDN